MTDIEPSSWIVVVKLGAPRPFALYQSAEEKKPFWEKTLQPGTAVFMNSTGNALVRHGVPVCDGVGPSGSIVSRCITSIVPWDEVQKNAQKVIEKRSRK